MTKRCINTQWFRAGAAALALVVLAALFRAPLPTLILSSGHGDSPVLVLPMLFHRTFTIEYTHSVQKTPVQEKFVYRPGQGLLLVSTTYKSLGVGLPFLPGEGNLLAEPGRFVLTGLNRRFEEINLGFTPLAEQALVYGGKRYYFKDYFLSGSLVKLQINEFFPIEIIRQRLSIKKEINIERAS